MLAIRGEKKIENKTCDKDVKDDKGKTYHVAERTYGVWLSRHPASARHRPVDSPGDHVKGRVEDRDLEAEVERRL